MLQENVMKTMKIKSSFSGNEIDAVMTLESEVIKDGRVKQISERNGRHLPRYLILVSSLSPLQLPLLTKIKSF